MTAALKADVLAGVYWLVRPSHEAEVAVIACGAVVPEAMEAHAQLVEDLPGTGLMIVTSPDRLEAGWRGSMARGQASQIERLLRDVPGEAGLITVVDAHPATLSWIGAVGRHRVIPLGVDRFGQSGDIPDLYRIYGIDADAIVTAAARLIAAQHIAPFGPCPVGEALYGSPSSRSRKAFAIHCPTLTASRTGA